MTPPETFNALVVIESDECVLWPHGQGARGYGKLWGDGIMQSVHVLACRARNGPAPSLKHEVAHSCRQPLCMNYRHLRWATHAENMADTIRHGTSTRGERHGAAKLTTADVHEIRRLTRTMTSSELGSLFNVSRASVNHVLAGRTWAWL